MSNPRGYVDIHNGQILSAEGALEAQRQHQKEELAKKNPPFIQLYKGVSPKIIQTITREYPIATEIFMFFLDNMDNDNVIAVSQTVIAETIDRSRPTVSKGIKVLEEHGALGIGKIGNNSVYLINTEMAWQKAYQGRRFAKMKGTFIFGKAENEKMFNKFLNVTESSKTDNKNNVKSLVTKSIVPITKQATQTEKPSVSVENPTETETPISDEHLEMDYSDSVIPEDVPPWEE